MRDLPVPDPGTPDHASPLRFLTWIARVQFRSLAAGAAYGIVWMLSQSLMPYVIGRAIDQGVVAKDDSALLAWSGALLALGAVQAFTGVMRHRMAVFNWLSSAYRTVQVVARQATRLGATLPKRLSTGEVVSVGANDVHHIGDAIDVTARGTGSIVAIVVVSVLLLVMSPPLGLIVVIGVPLILAVAAPLLRPMHERQERARSLSGELNTRAADIVAGLRVLRGVGGERLFAGRYRAESQSVRWAGVEVARAESKLSGAEVLLPGVLIALVTWLGAHFALDGRITVGQLVSFYGFAVFLIEPMRTVGELAGKLTKAHVAAGRVIRILDLEPEVPLTGTQVPREGAELADPESGLAVRHGQVTALVATDPADAKALADRLGGYTPSTVTYGGIPLIELAGLRRRILVALNEDRLFTGRLVDEVGAQRFDAAVHAACAEDVVDAVGRDAEVAEGGREFSGGQQQRLRLARALAADPEVLVLVEPTSAVDAHTEARIAQRLGAARRGRTTVVCTSSPLVLAHADQVVFLAGGRVVAEGTHDELLAAEPGYRAVVTRDTETDPLPVGES
jgi:ABC-type multidrug transport system fused ATPase/permease subunit